MCVAFAAIFGAWRWGSATIREIEREAAQASILEDGRDPDMYRGRELFTDAELDALRAERAHIVAGEGP
jgi:hypothetical protein